MAQNSVMGTAVISQGPATPQRISSIRHSTANDPQLQTVHSCINLEWPEYIEHGSELVRDFCQVRRSVRARDGLIVRGCCIVIPVDMRESVLDRIHEGNQGLTKCRERALQSVWLPKMRQNIATKVQQCPDCTENKNAKCTSNKTMAKSSNRSV